MLKIRDDVDLKELEKFGFTPEIINYPQYDINNQIVAYERTLHENEKSGAIIEVGYHHKEISINADLYKNYNNSKFNDIIITNLDILFDLIQANLVEKI